VGKFDTSVSLF